MEIVQKVQVKITELQAMNALQSADEGNGVASNTIPLDDLSHQTNVNKKLFVLKKDKSCLKKNESKAKGGKQSSKFSQKEEFEDGEVVDYYDINAKHCVEAVIVGRITYGQYAIRVDKRTLLRKAFFLSKKSH